MNMEYHPYKCEICGKPFASKDPELGLCRDHVLVDVPRRLNGPYVDGVHIDEMYAPEVALTD